MKDGEERHEKPQHRYQELGIHCRRQSIMEGNPDLKSQVRWEETEDDSNGEGKNG